MCAENGRQVVCLDEQKVRACEKTIAGLEGVGSKVKTFQLNSAKSEDTNAALTLLNRTQGCSLAENMSRVSELTSTTRVSERYRLSFACLSLVFFALICTYLPCFVAISTRYKEKTLTGLQERVEMLLRFCSRSRRFYSSFSLRMRSISRLLASVGRNNNCSVLAFPTSHLY